MDFPICSFFTPTPNRSDHPKWRSTPGTPPPKRRCWAALPSCSPARRWVGIIGIARSDITKTAVFFKWGRTMLGIYNQRLCLQCIYSFWFLFLDKHWTVFSKIGESWAPTFFATNMWILSAPTSGCHQQTSLKIIAIAQQSETVILWRSFDRLFFQAIFCRGGPRNAFLAISGVFQMSSYPLIWCLRQYQIWLVVE